jgi:hypothetical protein
VRTPAKNWPDVVGANGRQVDLEDLLKVPERWKDAIAELIKATERTAP